MLTETFSPTPAAALTARLDAQVHAALARVSASLSTASASPGKQMELGRLGLHQAEQLSNYLRECQLAGPGEARACVEPPVKYNILDLSPQNSLIKYLTDQGHTVFCVSWKNPGVAERDLGMDDYLELGFHAALDAVNAIVPKRRVHAAGYCLGGTLLAIAIAIAIAAAATARDAANDDWRLASLTLFAAQTDFSEPGELGLFIDESQVSLLEAQIAEVGYQTAAQMAGAFSRLRSYELRWSRLVSEYLLGDREPMNDLMAWNGDATRMLAKMHSQCLRRLFLNDDLSEGRYPVGSKPVSLADITLPTFVVSTVTDHVAPWRSVHKLHHLSPAEIMFVLTSGGHNAGIVSPRGHPRRHYRILERAAGGVYVAPDDWLGAAPEVQGSWWPAWQQWLAARSDTRARPPRTGSPVYRPVCNASGSYVTMTHVLQRKKELFVDIANEHTIAWGCARVFHAVGDELAVTWLNDKARPHVEPLAQQQQGAIVMSLDVEQPGQLEAVFAAIERQWGRLDFVLHSIAAPRDDLHGRETDSSREGFARAMDISCHSSIRMAHLAEPLMTHGDSLLTMSYFGAEEVVANYGLMGPVNAALESSVRYFACELGPRGIRVNAVSPESLATRAAFGVSDFDDLLARAAAPAGGHRRRGRVERLSRQRRACHHGRHPVCRRRLEHPRLRRLA